MRKTKLALALFLATLYAVPTTPALAGSKGRRNTAFALSALGAYHLFKGHWSEGIVAGGGAAYAWKRHEDARHHERPFGW